MKQEDNLSKTSGSERDYSTEELKDSLRQYSFERATSLRPKNLEKCLKFEMGRQKLSKFYKLDFSEQRNRLVNLGEEIHNFNSNIPGALQRTKREVFVPEEKRVLSYIEAPSWVSGLNGITPPLFCGKTARMLRNSL